MLHQKPNSSKFKIHHVFSHSVINKSVNNKQLSANFKLVKQTLIPFINYPLEIFQKQPDKLLLKKVELPIIINAHKSL